MVKIGHKKIEKINQKKSIYRIARRFSCFKKKNCVRFCKFACVNGSSLTWNLCSSESSRISCACFRSNHWSSRRGVFKDIMTLYHSFCEAYKNNFLSVSNRIRVLYLYYREWAKKTLFKNTLLGSKRILSGCSNKFWTF